MSEVRHSTLYLPDGDVVLAAVRPATATTVLFRVDKVYLARNSPVFRSMFTLPSYPGINEMYDGVPRVQLADDADDLARLLAALYDSSSLALERLYPDTPLLMTGVMRLAGKYEIDTIRGLIVKHIEADWPQTLEDWDAHQAERAAAAQAYIDNKDKKFKDKYFDEVYPEPVAAIRFALEFDVPRILPAAWYQLATTDAKAHLDYETVREQPSLRLFSAPCSAKARWQLLQADASLLTITLFGKAKMEDYMKVGEHILRNSALACETSQRCEQSGFKKAREFLALYGTPADPLTGIKQILASGLWDTDMCAECITYKHKQLQRARRTIWEALPEDFQLPQWGAAVTPTE